MSNCSVKGKSHLKRLLRVVINLGGLVAFSSGFHSIRRRVYLFNNSPADLPQYYASATFKLAHGTRVTMLPQRVISFLIAFSE